MHANLMPACAKATNPNDVQQAIQLLFLYPVSIVIDIAGHIGYTKMCVTVKERRG